MSEHREHFFNAGLREPYPPKAHGPEFVPGPEREDVAYLRRQLDAANTQARNWETAANANRDAAMGFQDRALAAERLLSKAQARIGKLEEALNKAKARAEFQLAEPPDADTEAFIDIINMIDAALEGR